MTLFGVALTGVQCHQWNEINGIYCRITNNRQNTSTHAQQGTRHILEHTRHKAHSRTQPTHTTRHILEHTYNKAHENDFERCDVQFCVAPLAIASCHTNPHRHVRLGWRIQIRGGHCHRYYRYPLYPTCTPLVTLLPHCRLGNFLRAIGWYWS